MKALKEFDYNLWTTEENGSKKYFVGIKATGEVTEVDAEVMRLLRNEEKKMRRYIEKQNEYGTLLSLDSYSGEVKSEAWMTDHYDLVADVQTEMMEADFISSLPPMQKAVYEYCIKYGGAPSSFADKRGITKQAVSNTLRKIREKAKIFFE